MCTIDFKFKVLKLFRDQFSRMKKHDFDALHNSFRKHSKNGYVLTINDLIDSIANVNNLQMDKTYLNEYFNDCHIKTQKDFIDYNYNCSYTKKKNDSKSLGIIFYPDLLSALFNGCMIDVQERLWTKFTQSAQLSKDWDGKIKFEQLMETLKTHDNLNEYNEITVQFIKRQYLRRRTGEVNFEEFLINFYLHDLVQIEEHKWKIERLIWIGYEKNSDNDKCLIAKLPKDLVKKCLSFVFSRLWQTIVMSNLTK